MCFNFNISENDPCMHKDMLIEYFIFSHKSNMAEHTQYVLSQISIIIMCMEVYFLNSMFT